LCPAVRSGPSRVIGILMQSRSFPFGICLRRRTASSRRPRLLMKSTSDLVAPHSFGGGLVQSRAIKADVRSRTLPPAHEEEGAAIPDSSQWNWASRRQTKPLRALTLAGLQQKNTATRLRQNDGGGHERTQHNFRTISYRLLPET
jgi:hypothetical protein